MEGIRGKRWAELQAEGSEIEELKAEVERNRTLAPERPRTGAAPSDGDGRDGDIRFTSDGLGTFAYFKVRGRWFKVRLENA